MRFANYTHRVHSPFTSRVRLILFSIAVLICGCASEPHTPAPVETLDMRIVEPEGPFQQETYTVQAGDTLFAIAFFSGNDYRDLARFNKLPAPYVIKPGDTLRLTAPPPPARRPTPPSRPTTSKASGQSDADSQTTSTHTKPTKTGGHTSAKSEQAAVDRSKEQAYGESEKDVNRQQVRRTFPARVERWIWPAEGTIIGGFDESESGNKGVDIANTSGTPVVAAASGKVVYTGSALRGYGQLVIIKHTDTFLSAYAHNDRILVSEQQWVNAGEQIGTMGSSGTDKVMLHFEVRYRGQSLDPMRYLPRR